MAFSSYNAAMKYPTYRFTVYDPARDTSSGLWNCHVRGSDVYLFARSIGYAFKVSLHTQTGECHLKYTPTFMDKNVGVLSEEYIDKWTFEREGGWVTPLTVITPPAAVNRPYQPIERKPFQFIPASPDEKATFVGLTITALGTEIKGDPPVIHALPGGEKLVIASGYGEMPEINAPEKIPMKFYKGISPESVTTTEGLRMLLLTGDGKSRNIFEFVGGSMG